PRRGRHRERLRDRCLHSEAQPVRAQRAGGVHGRGGGHRTPARRRRDRLLLTREENGREDQAHPPLAGLRARRRARPPHRRCCRPARRPGPGGGHHPTAPTRPRPRGRGGGRGGGWWGTGTGRDRAGTGTEADPQAGQPQEAVRRRRHPARRHSHRGRHMPQVTETNVLPDGTPAEGVTIRWTLVGATRAFLSDDDETVLSTLTVKTDSSGQYLVDLPANSDLNPSGTLWRRTIVGGERF